MADTSLIIGNGNWAVKEDSLLGYNIIQGKYVPIEMNVSRATTATRVNSAGLIELVPRNLLTYSQQIDNTDWVKTNAPTITTNIALAPDGTTTADGIKADDAVNFKYISQTKTVAANSTVTSSVFVKKETSETNFGGFNIYFTGGTPKICYVIVNAVNGTATISNSTITPIVSVVDFGAYWRISATATDNGSNTLLQCAYYATLSTSGTNILQAVGSVRTVWGFQLEVAATATEYFPTTDRFDIPRIDYSTGTASLLVEPARTNLVLRSEEFDNVSWLKTATTVTANTTTSPDETTTADTVTGIGAIGPRLIQSNSISFTTGTSYSLSVFAKKGTNDFIQLFVPLIIGGMSANFNINTGVVGTLATVSGTAPTSSIINYGNGWYRCTMNFTATTTTSTVTSISIVTSASAARSESNTLTTSIILWGAQAEAGTSPTSYIPTVASQLQRNADVIKNTSATTLIGQTEGTLYAEFNNTLMTYAAQGYVMRIFADASNEVFIRKEAGSSTYTARWRANGVNVFTEFSIAVLNGNNKMAIAYKSGDSAVYLNGAPIGTTPKVATGAFSVAPSQIAIGSSSTIDFFNDRIESATLFPTRLTPEQLATLTTII